MTKTDMEEKTIVNRGTQYFKMTLTMIGLIVLVRLLSFQTAITFPIAIIILSVPIIIYNFYIISMMKKITLSKFHTEGKIFSFFSRRKILYAIFIILTPILSAYSLIKMYGFSYKEWLIVFFMIPVFSFIYNFLKKHIKKELFEKYVNVIVFRNAFIITYIIIVLIFSLLLFFSGEYDLTTINSLGDTVKLQENVFANLQSCTIAYTIAQYVAFFNGVIIYFISNLSGFWLFLSILVIAGEGIVFYNILSVFSLHLLNKKELSVVFRPLRKNNTKTENKYNLIIKLSILILAIISLYSYAYISLGYSLKNNKTLIKIVKVPQEVVVDMIDGKLVNVGTIEKIDKLKREMKNEISNKISQNFDKPFDMAIDNVDIYLDKYYSLTAEVLRTINIFNLDEYIKGKMKEMIFDSKFTKVFTEAKENLPEIVKESSLKFKKLSDKIIKENLIKLNPFDTALVNKKASINKILDNMSKTSNKIPIEFRSGVAIISSFIVGVIVTKATYKLGIKVLTKIIAKKAVGKLAIFASGALIGGGTGSVVPGAGNVVGAAIGGIAAFIGSFFATEYGMVKLEELVNREKHKREIIEAINESRNELKRWEL